MATRKARRSPAVHESRRSSIHETRHFKPIDLERRYNINAVTRWRWEKKGTIPPRDVFRDGEPWGWTEATIVASEQPRSGAKTTAPASSLAIAAGSA